MHPSIYDLTDTRIYIFIFDVTFPEMIVSKMFILECFNILNVYF